MEATLQSSEVAAGAEVKARTARLHAPKAGSIYSFLPAHDGSRAGAVTARLSRTFTEDFGLVVLLADFVAHGSWPQHGKMVCVDLTGASEVDARAALRASDGIFMVTTSDQASLESVREKLDWLRAIGRQDQCGILLERVPGGASASEAEEFTGLPVCSLIETEEHYAGLARWLAAAV